MLTAAIALAFALAPTDVCSPAERAAGLCDVSSDWREGSLEISAEIGGDSDGSSGGAEGEGESSRESDDPSGIVGDGFRCSSPLGRCGAYEVVMRRDPTMRDVESFAPRLLAVSPEPAGFGVVGLPVNVVAAARVHEVRGQLFDLQVNVRFRPVSYRFDYGDGTTRTVATGGRSWDALGVPQFTPTTTSHVYPRRGTYAIRASVSFEAHVDFGNGWERVPGHLAVPAGTSSIEILEARTALVEKTCAEDPRGTGC